MNWYAKLGNSEVRQKSYHNTTMFQGSQPEWWKEYETLNLGFDIYVEATAMGKDCTLKQDIHKSQLEGRKIKEVRQVTEDSKVSVFMKDNQGTVRFRKKIFASKKKFII